MGHEGPGVTGFVVGREQKVGPQGFWYSVAKDVGGGALNLVSHCRGLRSLTVCVQNQWEWGVDQIGSSLEVATRSVCGYLGSSEWLVVGARSCHLLEWTAREGPLCSRWHLVPQISWRPQKDTRLCHPEPSREFQGFLGALADRWPQRSQAWSNLVALNRAGEIGWVMIQDGFLPEDDDPLDCPPEDVLGINFGGGSFEETRANPVEHRSNLGALEMGHDASLDWFYLFLSTHSVMYILCLRSFVYINRGALYSASTFCSFAT